MKVMYQPTQEMITKVNSEKFCKKQKLIIRTDVHQALLRETGLIEDDASEESEETGKAQKKINTIDH